MTRNATAASLAYAKTTLGVAAIVEPLSGSRPS